MLQRVDEIRRNLAGFARREIPGGRRAAVAVTIYERGGIPGVMVVKRAPKGLNAGQWALPGGRIDPGEGVGEAARRELAEELDLHLGPDAELGLLDDYATRSGYVITPVVLWAGGDVALTPNPTEVAQVHRVPLRVIDVEPRFVTIPESDAPVIQLPLFGRFVHAPTGAVLHQFREVVLHRRATRVAHFEQPVFAWR